MEAMFAVAMGQKRYAYCRWIIVNYFQHQITADYRTSCNGPPYAYIPVIKHPEYPTSSYTDSAGIVISKEENMGDPTQPYQVHYSKPTPRTIDDWGKPEQREPPQKLVGEEG